MKEKYKDFMCLIQVMICDKKLGVAKQFYIVPDVTCKKLLFQTILFQFKLLCKKSSLKHNFFVSKSLIYPEKAQKGWRLSYHSK